MRAVAAVPSPTISLRAYFSTYFLWDALHQAEFAGQIEAHHAGQSRFSLEHRGYVLSSVVASACFLEAMVSELYQDAADNHASYIAPLLPEARQLMAELWRTTNESKGLGTLERYQMLFAFAGTPLDRGGQVGRPVSTDDVRRVAPRAVRPGRGGWQ